MLRLDAIAKSYTTDSFTQVALDHVSLDLRDNEFVAILGPSGSGKTTLLNVLGGLDHADSGDIIVGGVSTRNYSDKDWDTYRNHRIGFIFQSYNLIPHQTVLSNVELALTLAGIPRGERRERARIALERVGLGEHVNKRPSQLSGGQMQRVAIARALVNDPDIVLADEPTGALDTETGLQVMDLLAEIAAERLVVMVTHNPELAEQYATRIVRLQDGKIVDDTNPIREGELIASAVSPLDAGGRRHAASGGKHARGPRHAQNTRPASTAAHSTGRRASMSFLTALSLSFNNLMTKKGRTFMTAFAGSIGIIGIAAILALSNGVNNYIAQTEEEALSSYPLTITKSSFDLTSLMVASMGTDDDDEEVSETKEGLIEQSAVVSDMFAQVKNNDLRAFRTFLQSGTSGVDPYVNSIQYSYGLNPLVYKSDTSKAVVRLNPSRISSTMSSGFSGSAFLGGSSMSSFNELLDDRRLLEQSLELVEGRWPEEYDECVVVLGRHGGITDYTLYSLGVYDIKVMEDMMTKALAGEEVSPPKTKVDFTREDAMALHFAVVPPTYLYRKNTDQGTWTDMTSDKEYMRRVLAENAVDLHVVGIVQQKEGSSSSGVTEGIAYTSKLTLYLMEESQKSAIVDEQLAKPDVDVFTGKTFDELADGEGTGFDMESMFSVDEEALRQAFSFDQSALEGLGQGIDLSGIDMSSSLGDINLGDIDMSGLDTSQMSSVFDEETMRTIMENAPAFSMDGVDLGLDTAQVELTDEQRTMLNDAVRSLATDFMKWASQQEGLIGGDEPVDYASLLEQYLQTEGAQAILAPLMEELTATLGEQLSQQLATSLNTYLSTQLIPYLIQSMMGLDPMQLVGGIDEETMQSIVDGAPQYTPDDMDLTGLGGSITDEQRAKINDAANALASDFAAWLMQNPQQLSSGDESQQGEGQEKEGQESEGQQKEDQEGEGQEKEDQEGEGQEKEDQDKEGQEGEGQQTDYAKLMEEYLKTESAQKIITPVMEELGSSVTDQLQEAISNAMTNYMTNQFAPYIATQMGSLMQTAAEALAAELATTVATGLQAQMSTVMGQVGLAIGDTLSSQMEQQMSQLSSAMESGFTVDADAFARAIQFNMTQEDLASLLSNYMNAEELSYEGNLSKLGYAEQDNPESISLYPKDFAAKESVLDIVDDYNDRMVKQGRDDSTITYTDITGVLMSSVTDIVNTISLVLIAFVSISLVVSSIMIAIITYISVLERKKEIGILRAMGASKLNVANIFNAETIIEGFIAGVLAIVVVLAASVPINAIVLETHDVPNIMSLPWDNALSLITVSVVLTLVAGLIPSSAASRRDPVEALRSE